MTVDGLHHVVLEVPDLAEAEAFYRDLFDLDVLFREGTKGETFGRVPDDLDWPAAIEKGVEPGMSFLGRDAFALALAAEDEEKDADARRLDHIALALDAEDRDAIRDRAADLGCECRTHSHSLFVTDRYGVEWELNASSPPPETSLETLDV